MKLYVDDARPCPEGWRLARTVEEAIAILTAETAEEVSLDFVIGAYYENNFTPVARFIAQMPAARRPKKVYLHTSSGAGARELRQILEGYVPEIIRV